MTQEERPEIGSRVQVTLQIEWVPPPDHLIVSANLFNVVETAEGVLLSVGQVDHPLLIGSPEDQAEQARAMETIHVRTLARLLLHPDRAVELHRALGEVLERRATRFEGADSE
jgi:hypothetical protein